MQRETPPFRADHVGSLLRPAELKEARARHQAGAIDGQQLKATEDRAIEATIAKQDAIGLRSATDGEFRRSMWHFDFLERLDGCEPFTPEQGIAFKGVPYGPRRATEENEDAASNVGRTPSSADRPPGRSNGRMPDGGVRRGPPHSDCVFKGVATKAKGVRVVGKLGFSGHPMLDHFRFLCEHTTRATPKMTIPSPSVLHFRGGRKAISQAVYPDLDDFYADLGAAYNRAVHAFADAGCRYLQLDETNLAYLCDPEQRQAVRDRGEDPDHLPEIYARMINAAIAGRPADLRITMHLCRGNFRSSWIAQGGYEPVAETLFHTIGVDGYFMEFDTERAGGFDPLRFVPKGKMVVLGLVTSKSGELESKDAIKRRIEDAARFLDLDQLCLSPQCGFASTEEGNLLTEGEQWAKLSRIVEIADDVWG